MRSLEYYAVNLTEAAHYQTIFGKSRKERGETQRSLGLTTLYFLQQDNAAGPIKIGHTIDLKSRISQLRTSNPNYLELLGTIIAQEDAVEEFIHDRLHPYHMTGEWYRSSRDVKKFISPYIQERFSLFVSSTLIIGPRGTPKGILSSPRMHAENSELYERLEKLKRPEPYNPLKTRRRFRR